MISLETEITNTLHLDQIMNGFSPSHDKVAQAVANGIPKVGKFISQRVLAPIGASMALHPLGWGIAAGIIGVGAVGYFASKLFSKK
jgi:hypothetical protein